MNDNTERQQTPRKPILCLDFDGVIHSYVSGWGQANFVPDPPVDGAMQFIADAQKEFEVHVHSARSSQAGGIGAMQAYLQHHLRKELGSEIGSSVYRLIKFPREKPPAFLTLDDRALTFDGNWPDVDGLLAFKPWNKQ